MSAYIDFYLKFKESDELKHIMCISRANELYNFFRTNDLSVYSADGSVKKKLDEDEFNVALNELVESINRNKRELETLKQFPNLKGFDKDYVTDTLSYIEEREDLLKQLQFFVVLFTNKEYTDLEEIQSTYD